MRESTVRLNKWLVMDGREAKRPFSWKTLASIANWIYDDLHVSKLDRLSVATHGEMGFMPAVANHIQSILLTKTHLPNFAELAARTGSFEWLANTHEIFNATLMRTDLLIQWHNIDR